MPIIKMESGPHYAKEVDEDGKFIRWLPHPDGNYKEKCTKLLEEVEEYGCNYFTESCRKFLDEKGFLSKAQVDCLNKILDEERSDSGC